MKKADQTIERYQKAIDRITQELGETSKELREGKVERARILEELATAREEIHRMQRDLKSVFAKAGVGTVAGAPPAPRVGSGRDSSLYRKVTESQVLRQPGVADDRGVDLGRSLRAALAKVNALTETVANTETAATGSAPTPEPGAKYVLADDQPEDDVSVNSRAILDSLQEELARIETSARKLRDELAQSSGMNKIKVAQLKHRLSLLQKERMRIETLLKSGQESAGHSESVPENNH